MRRGFRWFREHAWGLLATLIALLLFVLTYAATPAAGNPESDGHYMWLYARSLAYDGDINFSNDYKICGDPGNKGVDRGGGKPDNPFYVGPSVIWVPALWIVRPFARFPSGEKEALTQACRGPITRAVLYTGPLLGSLTVLCLYFIGRRWASARTAALGAVLLGMGTSVVAYACVYPSFSHVYDTFWTALLVLVSLRAATSELPAIQSRIDFSERETVVKDIRYARWAMVGLVFGVCILQRPVGIALGAIPVALAIDRYAFPVRHKSRSPRWRALAISLALIAAGGLAFGVIPQGEIYKSLYAKFWAGAPAGRYFMQFGHAHPLLVLFAPHGGLFYQTPIVWLPVLGLPVALRHRATRAYAIGALLSSALLVYISGAAVDWDSSGTFGCRRLCSLIGVLAPLAAMALTRIALFLRKPNRAQLALGCAVAAPVIFMTIGGAHGLYTGRLAYLGMTQEQAYGGSVAEGFALLDRYVGDLSILPAEMFWALRYRVPMRTFRDGTEAHYIRNYRNMDFLWTDVPILEPRFRLLTPGFSPFEEGLMMVRSKARVVFTAQWPHATHMRLRVRAEVPTTLRVGSSKLLSTTWYEDVAVASAEPQTKRLPVPPGAFDSGVNELEFSCPDSSARIVVSLLGFDDDTKYLPPI
jgi:hypothetical protein